MYKKILTILVLMLVLSMLNPQETRANQSDAQGGGVDQVVSHINPNLGRQTLSSNVVDNSKAKPMPLRVKGGQVPSDLGKDIATLSSGTFHYSYPAKPGGNVQAINTANSHGVSYTPYIQSKYPPLFSRYAEDGSIVDIYPNNTIGVLFFNQNGNLYRCSAVFVYRNVVWTAGHCIHDGNSGEAGWSDNFVFYPAWKDGAVNPLYGSYSNWTNSFVSSGWMTKGNLGADFGAVIFDNTVNAEYPGDTLGYMGFETSQSEAQSWLIHGYPAVSPFDGNNMYTCLSTFTRRDTSISPATVGFGCDLTGGTSGSPLIRRFSYKGGWVNGTYSYLYNSKPKEIFSPYFGNSAWNIFCTAIKADPNATPIPTGC